MNSGILQMMISLKEELYPDGKPNFEIFKISEHQFNIDFLVPLHLTYFRGHFPDFPVLPAVALMDITLFFTELAFELPQPYLEKIKQLKIFSRVSPGHRIKLQLSEDPSAAFFKAHWITDDEKNKIADITFSCSH